VLSVVRFWFLAFASMGDDDNALIIFNQ
jgi:hypothetical protein